MTYEDQPDFPPMLEGQISGEEYDVALEEVTRLNRVIRRLGEVSNYLVNTVSATQGEELMQFARSTPEGYAWIESAYATIKPEDIPRVLEDHKDLEFARRILDSRTSSLEASMWQEKGKRLFTNWQAGELSAHDALAQYREFWDVYSPDDYYEHCGVTREQVAAIFDASLRKYLSVLEGFTLDEVSSTRQFMQNLSYAARDLGLNPADYGL